MNRICVLSVVSFCAGSGIMEAQTPTFSLWVTEVNGVPCASCPTQELPAGEAVAGDVIRIDAFLEGWDDNRSRGLCSGNFYNGPFACTIGAPGVCTGMHCSDGNAVPCIVNSNCNSNLCVPSTCLPFPLVGTFQFTIDSSSYESGASGAVAPSRIACIPAECSDLTRGDCACTHYFSSASECSCLSGARCLPEGYCAAPASAYIDLTRADWIFYQAQYIAAVATVVPNWEWGSTRFGGGTSDNGLRQYLGTHLLTPALDARGTFNIRFVDDQDYTFALAANGELIGPSTLVPAVIHIACTPESCNDGDACTVDVCGDDGESCSHQPRDCPAGMFCAGGRCIQLAKPGGRW